MFLLSSLTKQHDDFAAKKDLLVVARSAITIPVITRTVLPSICSFVVAEAARHVVRFVVATRRYNTGEALEPRLEGCST